jgi:two-component system chemotaxis sensor kinase CheA
MAAIDLSRFQATFFAESREGLDAMETGLLSMESGSADGETINTIFRAAHSIKGGSATFGFKAIADTTHLLETLLDQVRSGKREADAAISDALLVSVDVLRGMLEHAEAGHPDTTGNAELNARLSALLDGQTSVVAAAKTSSRHSKWKIGFAPKPGMYLTGNDPLRIARELAGLGKLTATCDTSHLPSLRDMDCTQSYLTWQFDLEADVERRTVEDVFSWVEDECELSIEGVRASRAAEPTPAPAAVPTATPAASREKKEHTEGDGSIRVAINKVDGLINLVGELVITQAMLVQQSAQLDPGLHERLLGGLAQLERNTRDLQEAVMSVRMLPVEFVFSRFPRLVRDLAGRLGKKVRLRTTGEGTELDKGVIERIIDPLTHLVRNAVDHGLELPEQRADDGKDATGSITLAASHQGGHIVIEVADDGRGLDRKRILAKAAERGLPVSDAMSDGDVWQLIFHPGLSTADKITDVSGRGVGMDVVKQNITALGGEVEIESHAGRGTRVRIRLPLTLAILDGMSVAVGDEIFILPLAYVVESLQPANDDIKRIGGTHRLLRVRGEHLPLLPLSKLFGTTTVKSGNVHGGVIVVVESDGRKLALEVDELVGQQQVVVKSIESNYRRVNGISGATILGDGRVALIVDVGGLTRSNAVAA